MLQWDPKYTSDPRTVRLARELGCLPAQARGHLLALFGWMLDYARDGCLSGIDHEAVAQGAEWPGEPDAFLRSLLRSQWCDRNGRVAEWQTVAGAALEEQRHNEYRSAAIRIFNNDPLRSAVKARDGDTCRLCQRKVNWHDRKSPNAATYARLDPYAEWTEANTVVAHKGCATSRPALRAVAPPTPPTADIYRSDPTADINRSPTSAENAEPQISTVSEATNGRKTVDDGRNLPFEPTADINRSASSANHTERQISTVERQISAVRTVDNGRYLPLAEGAFEASLSSNPERQISTVRPPSRARALELPSGFNPENVSGELADFPTTTSRSGGGPRAGADEHARASSPPPPPPRKREFVLSDIQRTKLIEAWQARFPGGADEVDRIITVAMNRRDAPDKWEDPYLYVDHWLKGDFDKLPENAKANGRARPPRVPPKPSEFARRFGGSST